MRVKHKVVVQIAEDTGMKNGLFNQDEQLNAVTIDGYEKQFSGIIKTLATETDTLSFGDVEAVKAVFMKLDRECIVTINGEAIQMRIAPGQPAPAFTRLFLEADIETLTVTAPVGGDVNGVYVVYGDELEDDE